MTWEEDPSSAHAALWGASARARDVMDVPSRHSESSRSSASRSSTVYRSHFVRGGSMRGTVIDRARSNQPGGYVASDHHGAAPTTHYCARHNYCFYPYAWTDEETGRAYQKGYYDENGEYYEDVAFLSDGKYKDVLCKCEYCDTVSKLDWVKDGPLICPQCGGTMKILSALDEYTRDPMYEKASREPGYVDYADRNKRSDRKAGDGKRRRVLAFVGFLVLLLVIISIVSAVKANRQGGSGDAPSNVELFGSTVYLKQVQPGVFRIADEKDWDRSLVWDRDEDCYYETESQLWLWYNTDVEPPLWQYWYEPISGDYGEYGWMEYEDGVWYIEASRNSWIRVPDRYDLTKLWHMENETGTIRNEPGQTNAIRIETSEIPVEDQDTDEDMFPKVNPDEDASVGVDTDEDVPLG